MRSSGAGSGGEWGEWAADVSVVEEPRCAPPLPPAAAAADAACAPERSGALLTRDEALDDARWRARLGANEVFGAGYTPKEWERGEVSAAIDSLGLLDPEDHPEYLVSEILHAHVLYLCCERTIFLLRQTVGTQKQRRGLFSSSTLSKKNKSARSRTRRAISSIFFLRPSGPQPVLLKRGPCWSTGRSAR